MAEIDSSSKPTEIQDNDNSLKEMEEGSVSLWEEIISSDKDVESRNSNIGSSKMLRVPFWLQQFPIVEQLFQPSLVSIGPYHRCRHKPDDEDKWRNQQQKLRCTKILFPDKNTFDNCLEVLKKLVSSARSCYIKKEEESMISDDEFLKMMVIDGCFIIALLISFNIISLSTKLSIYDVIYFCIELREPKLLDELLLMENQIPLFILRAIVGVCDRVEFDTSQGHHIYGYHDDSFDWYFIVQHLKPDDKEHSKPDHKEHSKPEDEEHSKSDDKEKRKFQNLLHLCHFSLFFNGQPRKSKGEHCCSNILWRCAGCLDSLWEIVMESFCSNCLFEWLRKITRKSSSGGSKQKFPIIHSATKLVDRGVVFKKKDGLSRMIFTKNGTLKIPCISIDDALVLNLLAFEQTYFVKEDHIAPDSDLVTKQIPLSNTIHFVASMITTTKDLEILEEHEIVVRGSSMTPESAVKFFGQLRSQLRLSKEDSHDYLCHEVNKFVMSKRNRWWAELKKNYFSNPWTSLSLVAAIILLIMTCLQTYYTVYAYYRPFH